MNYDYPGNVRELKNTLDRMVVLSQDHVITTEGIPILYNLKRMTPVTTYSAHQLVTWKEFKRRSEKEYLERKNRFDSGRVAAENKLKELTETHIASGVDESAFMKSASAFLLTHKIRAGSHIVYSDLAGMVEEESIKEFFNLVLDHIVVKDRRVAEIVFANGLSHKFIYRD